MNQTNNNPLVTIVMATFNESPEMITKAINSILYQSYKNLELLILDDSTAIDSKNAIDSVVANDTRVKVIRKEQRMGFVPALNEGIRLSKGKYIARMDGDDIAL